MTGKHKAEVIIEKFEQSKITKEEAVAELRDLLHDYTNPITYDKALGENAGEIAKRFKVAVGEIGCRKCGTIARGALLKNTCNWCGATLIVSIEESLNQK